MKEYVFPALLTQDGDGYDVTFPDLPHCYTCGDNLSHSLQMAEDVLAMWLVQMENDKEQIPEPSDVKTIHPGNGIVTLIRADTLAYRRRTNSQAVKKTLSIPQWMNEAAEKQGINFSQTLQEALEKRLQTAE